MNTYFYIAPGLIVPWLEIVVAIIAFALTLGLAVARAYGRADSVPEVNPDLVRRNTIVGLLLGVLAAAASPYWYRLFGLVTDNKTFGYFEYERAWWLALNMLNGVFPGLILACLVSLVLACFGRFGRVLAGFIIIPTVISGGIPLIVIGTPVLVAGIGLVGACILPLVALWSLPRSLRGAWLLCDYFLARKQLVDHVSSAIANGTSVSGSVVSNALGQGPHIVANPPSVVRSKHDAAKLDALSHVLALDAALIEQLIEREQQLAIAEVQKSKGKNP